MVVGVVFSTHGMPVVYRTTLTNVKCQSMLINKDQKGVIDISLIGIDRH